MSVVADRKMQCANGQVIVSGVKYNVACEDRLKRSCPHRTFNAMITILHQHT